MSWMARHRRVVLFMLGAGLAVIAASPLRAAVAQPTPDQPAACSRRGPAAGSSKLVDVTLAGGGPVRALEKVIRELLGRLDVTVCAVNTARVEASAVVSPPEDPRPALARVWIAPTGRGATVFVVDADWNRILIRHVPLPDGFEVAAREELAQIVYATIEALLAGAYLGVAKPARPPPLSPPYRQSAELQLRQASRLAGRGSPVDLELGLAGTLVDKSSRFKPTLGVVLAYRFPATATTDAIDIRSSGAQLRFELGMHLRLGRATALRPAVGLGVEAEFVDPRHVPGSDVLPEPTKTALWPLAMAQVAVHHQVAGRLWLAAALGADLDLLGAHYTVLDNGESTRVVDPWFLRPALWFALVTEL